MKQLLRTAFCLLLGSALFACGPTKEPLTRQTLEAGFVTPPDSIQTSVYWYWMSNNLSKEGVVKDLQAMKKSGNQPCVHRQYQGWPYSQRAG